MSQTGAAPRLEGMTHENEVIVVGGGLCGLAAARLVARAGVPVTVLERRSAPGGRAATLEREGFALTEGAHALYRAGAAARPLHELGVAAPGRTPDAAKGTVMWRGGLERSPFGPFAMTRTGLLGLREKAVLGRLLLGLPRRDPSEAAGMSAEQWIAEQRGGERVHELLRALTRLLTYTGDLEGLSGEVAVLQLGLGMGENVTYVDGGWATLVQGLSQGVHVRSGVTVEAVEPGPVVRTADGEELRPRAVILAGLPPAAVARLTGAELPPLGPPVEAACLDVALRELPVPGHHWNLGIDEPVYVSDYSHWARLAPDGGAVVHVARMLRPGERAPREELEAALDRVQPGWRDVLVHANFLPAMTVVHVMPDPRTGLAGRPGTDVAGIDGVFAAGDWIGPEGWLADGALASAAQAARAAIRAEVPAAA
jgi:phytoene dehydrogenase-like protein